MKAILGCFRTTPNYAMERETGLLPTHLRLQSKILRAYTRMQTLPTNHPVKQYLQRAAIPQHIYAPITTLEYIQKAFPESGKNTMETILPYAPPPWWISPHSTCIDTSKDAAEQRHNEVMLNLPGILSIYTDGSALNGHVGASAYCPELQATEVLYLG